MNYIYHIEILAALVASFTYKWFKNTPSKYFLLYLWFVVFIETLGHLPGVYNHNYDGFVITFLKNIVPENLLKHNIWLMNLYDIVTYNFYLLYFYLLIKTGPLKKWILLFFVLLWSVIIYTLIDYGAAFNEKYLYNVIIIGSLLILICSIFYFLDLLKTDLIVDIHRTLPFWIIIGTLFFQLAATPIFIFSKELNFSATVYNVILSICNFIMYGSFIIGFIINAWEQKKKILR